MRSAAGSVVENVRQSLARPEVLPPEPIAPAFTPDKPAQSDQVTKATRKNNADWRLDEIVKVLVARGVVEMHALPTGTKTSVCAELCKRYSGKFNDAKGGTFDKAWQAGVKAGLFRMLDNDIFNGKME